jgi:hypothetical protein
MGVGVMVGADEAGAKPVGGMPVGMASAVTVTNLNAGL